MAEALLENITELNPTDVLLRACYDVLNRLDNALASIATDKLRVSIVDSLPAGDNEIGRVRLRGYDYDNTTWRDVAVDSSGRVRATLQ